MRTKPKLLCLLAVSTLALFTGPTPAMARPSPLIPSPLVLYPWLRLQPVNSSELRSKFRFKFSVQTLSAFDQSYNRPYIVTATYRYYRATQPNWVTKSITERYTFYAYVPTGTTVMVAETAPRLDREVERDMQNQGYSLCFYTIKLQATNHIFVEEPDELTYAYPASALP